MEKKQTDSVQNRFTAYLMAAVANKRISYMEQRNRKKEKEYIQVDLMDTVNARFYVYPPKKKSDILYLVTDNPRTIVYNYFYTS